MIEDDFFDLLTRTQSKRMDDQRCSLKVMGAAPGDRKPLQQHNQENIGGGGGGGVAGNRYQLLEMIADLQSERMDEQRAALPGLIGNALTPVKRERKADEPDDAFLDMLMRCQGSRLEEQRSELPRTNVTLDAEDANARKSSVIGATVPDEDFFSLISRVQGGRMEDQRATIPALRRYATSNSNNTNDSVMKQGTGSTKGNK